MPKLEHTISHHVAGRGRGIGVRLLLAQAIVSVVGAATIGIVAVLVGPPLFREHLHRAGVPDGSSEQAHAEEAYRYATVISVGVALAASLLTALLVSLYLSRRLGRPITDVSAAAAAIADGRYGYRVQAPRLGEEFDALARAFNQMAARLETVEATRRRLFGDLAHEIRTPVSVIEAYLEALEDGVKSLDTESAGVLRDQARRLVRFSDDLAALAQAEESVGAIAPTAVSPARLIATVVAAAGDRFAAKGVTLIADADDGLPQVWLDQHRFAQVLSNLLDNALRHTAAGGRVDIGANAGDRLLEITVTDDGEGVAAQHLPDLFERFYRVDTARDRDHGGAGIGLAIARALVQAHDGHIVASSRGPGTGTTFTVTVPIRGR